MSRPVKESVLYTEFGPVRAKPYAWLKIGLAITAGYIAYEVLRRRSTSGLRLRSWEQEAANMGDVGDSEGKGEAESAAIGLGTPAEQCILLGSAGDEDPHCVVDPLGDPRFKPVDRGAPESSIPTSSTWPVRTRHGGRLLVSYWTAGGVRGYSGRAFATLRTDVEDGHPVERRHAGVDLFARDRDVVVAPESGTIMAILPFNSGTWAIYLRSGGRIINLGEVEKLSWREFGIAPGQDVIEGQPLARVGMQGKGSTMIHLETYEVGSLPDADVIAAIRGHDLSWPHGQPPPQWLRDPSGYLIMAASRTYRRETSGIA